MALSRVVPMFNSVLTKLRRAGPPSLLQSGNSSEAPTLARLDSVIVYFCPFTIVPQFAWAGLMLCRDHVKWICASSIASYGSCPRMNLYSAFSYS